MNKTRLIRKLFVPRLRQLDRYVTDAEFLQRKVLISLLKQGKLTQWGEAHDYGKILSYEQFVNSSGVNTYEDLKNYIDRMRHGERDVLWPGRVRWYAKSSGTTNDKSKFIPVSQAGLQDTHYRGGADAVTWYLHNTPNSRLFDGRALILGGSHTPNYSLPHSLVGDLSAILIENINPLVNLVRIPKKKTALLSDFEEKRERIAQEAIGKNVTNLSGVPSWMMSVMDRVLIISGKEHMPVIRKLASQLLKRPGAGETLLFNGLNLFQLSLSGINDTVLHISGPPPSCGRYGHPPAGGR